MARLLLNVVLVSVTFEPAPRLMRPPPRLIAKFVLKVVFVAVSVLPSV
jgi:hypothetical protein